MAIQFDTWETSITNELEQIKNAVYGKDVRQALHDGLEKGFDKANSAASYAKSIKQEYDNILMQWDSDPNKDPELIDARGTFAQLDDRLNNHDTQLQDVDAVEAELASLQAEYDAYKIEQESFHNYFKPLENAIYSWWVSPTAVNRQDKGNKTFVTYVDADGTQGVACYDHEKKTRSRVTLAQFEQNDHNAPAINFMDDGRVVVFYFRHNKENGFRYRISTEPEDITTFGDEQFFDSGDVVTYVQAVTQSDMNIRVFWRTGVYKWGYAIFKKKPDPVVGVGEGFSTAERIILDGGSGQYYIQGMPFSERTQYMRLFMYGHPINDPTKNEVRMGYIDTYGEIKTVGGVVLGNLGGTNLPLSPNDFEIAYQPESGRKVRLLDTAVDETARFVVADFADATDATYKEVVYETDAFVSYDITNSGIPIEEPAGGNFYFGGANFDKTDISKIYLAREDAGKWTIERWKKTEDVWAHDETIYRSRQKLFRPLAVLGYPGDTNVVFCRGDYTGYTDYQADIILK